MVNQGAIDSKTAMKVLQGKLTFAQGTALLLRRLRRTEDGADYCQDWYYSSQQWADEALAERIRWIEDAVGAK